MKIDILIPNFGDLGAQRVAINVANYLSTKYDISFVVLDESGPFRNYLHPDVATKVLSDSFISKIPKLRVVGRQIDYIRHVRLNRTELSISFSPVCNLYVLFAKLTNPSLFTVIQEHAYPSTALKDRANCSSLSEFLFKKFWAKLYNSSDVFLTIALAIKNDFIANYGIRSDYFRIVRNPIDIGRIESMAKETVDDYEFKDSITYIAAVGRLAPQKNYSRMLRVLEAILKHRNNIRLLIIGKGPLLDSLKIEAKTMGVDHVVDFIGFQHNPYKYMSRCSLFWLTSDWEGLPQVIAEAMICKLPVISHRCNSGPEEMIIHDQTGLLVEFNDIVSMANLSHELLINKMKLCELATNAYQYAQREYSINEIGRQYDELITNIPHNKANR